MKNLLSTLAFLALPVLTLAQAPAAPAAAPAAAVPAKKVDASAPIVKSANGVPQPAFIKAHESFLARGKSGPIDVLFLGDSITAGWTKAPHIWEAYYGKNQPANFGIGGDTTQNVIWRIENGELDGIHPKVTVLMLGTNNSASHTGAEIAAADTKIVQMIQAKIPETKVLLLAIFPRGVPKEKDGTFTEAKIAETKRRVDANNEANAILAKLDDGKTVRYLDIGASFLGQDGKIPFALMPDQLHPNAAGYQLWADAMKPLLTQMLK